MKKDARIGEWGGMGSVLKGDYFVCVCVCAGGMTWGTIGP